MAMQTINIGGQQYVPGSPEAQAAQNAYTVQQTGVGGTAAGTGEANYLNELSPSLMGLYSAVGLGGSSGYGAGAVPGRVAYPTSGGGGSTASLAMPGSVTAPSDVSSSGLTSGEQGTYNPTATIAPLNLAASDNAAFANAKDQAGQTAQASMTGLQQALAARGMGGAGYEAGQIGNTLATAANQIGAAGRAQAIEDANLTAEGNVANLGAQVSQRGQDIGAQQGAASRALAGQEAAYSGDIAQRQQTLSAAEEDANRQAEAASTAYGGSISQEEAAANRAASAANSAYGGAVTQRQQDISAAEQAAELAQQQAQLKSTNTLAILQSVLGGGRGGAYAY